MRAYACVLAAIVAGCGGNGSTTVTPSSTPPSDNGGGGGGGNGGGNGGGGGGAGGMPGGGGGGGMPGGGGGGGGGGSACTSTTPEKLASASQVDMDGLAVDDDTVWFVTKSLTSPATATDWVLDRAPATGGAITPVGSTGDYAATILAINADAVFSASSFGHIVRWPKDGSAATVLVDNGANLRAVADAGGYIYFGDQYGIHRIGETGGTAALIGPNNGVWAMAFDDSNVWFVNQRAVLRVPRDGGTVTESIDVPAQLFGIAVDATHVYVGASDGNLYVADKHDGATPTVLASSGAENVDELALDGGHLYFRAVANDATGLHDLAGRVNVDGSGMTTLVNTAGFIGQLAVRGDYLYYAYANDRSVYRVCK